MSAIARIQRSSMGPDHLPKWLRWRHRGALIPRATEAQNHPTLRSSATNRPSDSAPNLPTAPKWTAEEAWIGRGGNWKHETPRTHTIRPRLPELGAPLPANEARHAWIEHLLRWLASAERPPPISLNRSAIPHATAVFNSLTCLLIYLHFLSLLTGSIRSIGVADCLSTSTSLLQSADICQVDPNHTRTHTSRVYNPTPRLSIQRPPRARTSPSILAR